MITSLNYKLTSRKGKLTTYLNNNSDELSLEKQHQLYGAINEIDTILELLSSHRNEEIEEEKNPDEVFLLRPIHSKGILHNLKAIIRELF